MAISTQNVITIVDAVNYFNQKAQSILNVATYHSGNYPKFSGSCTGGLRGSNESTYLTNPNALPSDALAAKSISVTIAGGEIMHDRYFDYQLWDKWFGDLVALLVDKQYTISVITNLITHKIDQLIDLQKKYKFTISSSFDLEGRFTKQKQVDLFLSNLQLLDSNDIDCELVMIAHKRNIKALKDPNHWLYNTFLQLYKTHTIVIDQYNDRNKLPDYNVSDEQLVDFFKWILINFPNIHGFEKYYNRSITKAGNCDKNTIDLLPFSVRWSCCDKKKQFSRLVDKFGCLTCPHIDYCVPDCPTDALKHNVCINRLMYDYVETTEKFKNKINE